MAAAEDSWGAFARTLAEVLPELQHRSFLTVSWVAAPTVYVQFSQRASELVAETGADDVMPTERRLGEAGAQRLRAAGWSPPDVAASGGRTWHTVVRWPVRSADYARLAEMCTAVLRAVHELPGPEVLEYRAWREAEPPPEGVTFDEEDLEPAEPHLAFPALGLDDAYAG